MKNIATYGPSELKRMMQVYYNSPEALIIASTPVKLPGGVQWAIEAINESGILINIKCGSDAKFTTEYVKPSDYVSSDLKYIQKAFRLAQEIDLHFPYDVSAIVDDPTGQWEILLENTVNGHNKFYEIKTDANLMSVRYGAIGNTGRESTEEYKTTGEAMQELGKKIYSKLNKGYVIKNIHKATKYPNMYTSTSTSTSIF
jgi:predicted DNA-binding WGR domain protein